VQYSSDNASLNIPEIALLIQAEAVNEWKEITADFFFLF